MKIIENVTGNNNKCNRMPCGYCSDYYTCYDCVYSSYEGNGEIYCGEKRKYYPSNDRICSYFEAAED